MSRLTICAPTRVSATAPVSRGICPSHGAATKAMAMSVKPCETTAVRPLPPRDLRATVLDVENDDAAPPTAADKSPLPTVASSMPGCALA